MRCSRCRGEAVLFQRYSGLALCGRHLREDVEARARREIRAQGGIRSGDRIAIVSGGPESEALARFLHRTFGKRRDLIFSALAAARSPGLEWIPVEGGNAPPVGATRDPRAPVQESTALRARVTVLVRADCLDVLAGQVLARVMRGEAPGGTRQPALRTLTPFRRIPREEIRLYAEGIGVPWDDAAPVAAGGEEESLARALLADHASRHPSAPHALLRLWDSLEGRGEGTRQRES